MPRVVLRVRREGQLLGSWTLDERLVELSLVDVATGRELAQVTATGQPARISQGLDELPVERVVRLAGDDLTVPLPEPTATMGDDLSMPPPDVLTAELTLPQPEPTAPLRPSPAEVWVRKRGAWQAAGHLVARQRVSMLGGWVRLHPDGRLIVFPGERLSGTGTLLDGRSVELANQAEPVALPPGASVVLRDGGNGLYVRSEPLPHERGPDGIGTFSERTTAERDAKPLDTGVWPSRQALLAGE